MRQFFVPACLCLMTWSGPIASDPKPFVEPFPGAHHAKVQPAAAADIKDTAHIEKPDAAIAGDDVRRIAADPATLPAVDDIKAVLDLDTEPEAAAICETPPQALQVIEAEPDSEAVSDSANLADLAIEIPVPSAGTSAPAIAEPPLPQRRPPPRPVVHRSREEVCETLTQAALDNRLPPPFFIRLLFQESRFKAAAVSPAGALGIAQFMPAVSASMGVDNPFDPLQAIPASARLLRDLFEQFGNLGLAAMAYNAGPKRIQDWLSKKGRLPKETENYVETVTGRPAETWKDKDGNAPEMRLPQRAPCQKAAGLYAWNGPDTIPLPPSAPPRDDRVAGAKDNSHEAEKAKEPAKRKSTRSADARHDKRAVQQLAARKHADKRGQAEKRAAKDHKRTEKRADESSDKHSDKPAGNKRAKKQKTRVAQE